MTEANALYHFGIKGQRWGVRRFQNADGTLTSDGRKRYRAYKKDWNAYNKLNRHVAASQKHLKEEGVMVDRVRDKYYKTNKDYEKEMRKSSGLFGSKAALKAERVANAQKNMDAAGSEYEKAAGAYGVAKKIANQDTKALRDHVDRMVKTYGKGSINELQTKTVKIGQNKLQKLMQGAPKSILFSNGRDTDEFVKTGLTLANMPVVGNLYTANYIAKRESELEKQRVEGSVRSAKRQLGGKNAAKYLDTEYFKDVSSLSDSKERNKAEREAKKAKKEAEKADKEAKKADKEAKKAEIKAQKADQKDRSGRYIDETYENIKDARKAAEAAKRAKQQDDKAEKAARKAEKALQKVRSSEYAEKTRNSIAEARKDSEARRSAYQQQEYERTMRKVENTKKTIKRNAKDARDYWQTSREMDKKTKQKLRSNPLKYYGTRAVVTTLGAAATAAAGPIAGYAARVAIKRHKKKKRQEAWDNFWGIKHSATYRVVRSDELYHHGIKGQRWGVRRYQNSDGTLTAKGRARYYSSVDVNKAFRETKNRPNVIKAKNVARTAAVVTAGFGGLTAGAVTGNPVVLGATPAAYLTAGYLANKAYIQDIKDYNEKYIRSSFTDTNSADDLEKIAPIRRNELKIDKNTEFTRISTKAQEDGKSRLYACLSADKKEIDYYAKDWPKYLEKIKQDPNIKVYKNTYKVNSEIVAPSLEKRKEIAQAILTADKHMKTELGKAYAMDQMRLSTGALYAKKLSDIKKLYATKEARANVDKYYNNMIAYTAHKDFSVINNSHNYRAFAASIPTSQKLMDAYAKELKKQGFNAVYDDNSNAKSAFIFFDQSMLKQLSSEELKHFWSAVLGNELYHVE